jgi:hypothetical protein
MVVVVVEEMTPQPLVLMEDQEGEGITVGLVAPGTPLLQARLRGVMAGVAPTLFLIMVAGVEVGHPL